jgi:DNA-nicking Smr family endonuclease
VSRKIPSLADHGLWEDVKRTIAPLKLKFNPDRTGHQKSLAQKLRSHASLGAAPIGLALVLPPTSHMPNHRHVVPPLASFDRRLAQKLARGQLEPEARLDLHGEGVETARMKLLHFLASHHQQGTRLVLVITGKGASPFARHTLHGQSHFHAPEREGRLRRELTDWLHEEIFRRHVIGFQPSHPRHGGGGAFYLRLRRSAGQENGREF